MAVTDVGGLYHVDLFFAKPVLKQCVTVIRFLSPDLRSQI